MDVIGLYEFLGGKWHGCLLVVSQLLLDIVGVHCHRLYPSQLDDLVVECPLLHNGFHKPELILVYFLPLTIEELPSDSKDNIERL